MKTNVIVELSDIQCPECGLIFWVEQEYKQHRHNNHKTIYCPNGHTLHYPAETEEERLRKLYLKKERDYRQVVVERDGYKNKLTTLRGRTNAGLCPYCRRHFMNLERHIKGKHPTS